MAQVGKLWSTRLRDAVLKAFGVFDEIVTFLSETYEIQHMSTR